MIVVYSLLNTSGGVSMRIVADRQILGDCNMTDSGGVHHVEENCPKASKPPRFSWFLTEMHCTILPLYPPIIIIIIIIIAEHVMSHK